MTNRRNHYRTLFVQPDASSEVIRANYRTLMRKLKLHPDLGGDHWNAVSLNAAYATLENPAQRAAYDVELLKRYGIATIARGPLRVKTRARTFYQVLQVQADAPVPIIEASFQTLLAQGAVPAEQLAEAFATLRDPARRKQYDRELETGERPAPASNLPAPRAAAGGDLVARYQNDGPSPAGYEPLITRYCLFCKTPHDASPAILKEAGCTECGSPLFAPPADFLDQARRAFGRSAIDEEVAFYTFWPGKRLKGRMVDLSPTGMRLVTPESCDVGDIIKIDAHRLQAVGAIVHQRRERATTTAGVKFHTVGFHGSLGSFLDARA